MNKIKPKLTKPKIDKDLIFKTIVWPKNFCEYANEAPQSDKRKIHNNKEPSWAPHKAATL